MDVDGTLEADAMTLNGTAITSTATLSTGISNNNVPKFTSGVADNDFLRVDGTAIEGRSASQVLSDIGGQASLTFGISNTNAVKIDSTSVADDEYARFTASGLESRSNAEVLSDIGAQASLTFGISNTNAVKIDSTSVADDEYARFTANGLESRSTSEVLSDIGGISASSTDTLTNKTLTTPVINGFSGTGDGSITGTTTTTSLRLTGTTDVTPSSTGHPFQIGASNSTNIAIDTNEIMARNNGSTSALFLNAEGSLVQIGGGLYLQGSAQTIIFEGATADEHETTLTVTDPTADRTITLPNASGTVQLTDGSGASLTSLNASQLSSGTVPNARLDAQLQDVAGLAVTNGGFIVGDGSNFVLETGSTARASLELGTAAVLDTGISNTNIPKFTSGVADNDFLRVDGTSIEGRSASEVLSDISAMPLAGGTFTGDVTFTGANYNIVFDSSDDALEFADNAKATFGAGADLQIYHDGSHSYIQDSGTGILQIISDQVKIESPTGETVARFIQDSNVILYEDNVERFRTTSTGTTTTGTSYITGNVVFEGSTADAHETTLTVTDPTADRTITLPNASGTVLTTANSDTPTTTTSSSDADFVLVDDGGTMKKITPANLGISQTTGASKGFAVAMAIAL